MTHQLTLTRILNAPIHKVFDAVSVELAEWNAPDSMTISSFHGTPAVGEKYSMTMQAISRPDFKMTLTGRYVSVQRPKMIRYTQSYVMPDGTTGEETTVEISLEELEDNTTNMTLTHSGFRSEKDSQNATKGWEQAIEKLAKYLETKYTKEI